MSTAYSRIINHTAVTAENLEDAKEGCVAISQRDELAPGCETWGILYEGGQRGQMSRWPNGRGAVCYGADSLWGDWNGEVLVLDDGGRVSEYGEPLDESAE